MPPTKITENQVKQLNQSNLWNNCISVGQQTKTDAYTLHATGDADLNGRKYIALPSSMNVNDPFKYFITFLKIFI